jgi:hypothetical protein
MDKIPAKELIIQTLKEKSGMKQDVYANTLKAFSLLKNVAKQTIFEIKKEISAIDKRIIVEFKDRSEFEFELRVAGDLLIFTMHTNVFEFDKSHQVWRSAYLKDDNQRAFCGMISIYNFLNDSFKYNRFNDSGYMIGRIFINKENHYFADGKRQLGFLFNNFVNSMIDEEALKLVLESSILYSINFDMFTPPFDAMKEISVADMQSASESMQIKTGKRLGFRFQADSDDID